MIAGVVCCQDMHRMVRVPCDCVEVDHAIERATAANPLVDGLKDRRIRSAWLWQAGEAEEKSAHGL